MELGMNIEAHVVTLGREQTRRFYNVTRIHYIFSEPRDLLYRLVYFGSNVHSTGISFSVRRSDDVHVCEFEAAPATEQATSFEEA